MNTTRHTLTRIILGASIAGCALVGAGVITGSHPLSSPVSFAADDGGAAPAPPQPAVVDNDKSKAPAQPSYDNPMP